MLYHESNNKHPQPPLTIQTPFNLTNTKLEKADSGQIRQRRKSHRQETPTERTTPEFDETTPVTAISKRIRRRSKRWWCGVPTSLIAPPVCASTWLGEGLDERR